jgi:hypothetical protein
VLRKGNFLELKDSSREKWYGNTLFADYVYLRFKPLVGDPIKELLVYPREATIVLGTERPTLLGTILICNTLCENYLQGV